MKMTMMAATLLAAGAALAAPAVGSATTIKPFAGPFAPNTFTTTSAGNVAGASAQFSTSSLTIVGADNPAIDPNSGVPACAGATTGFMSACQITIAHTNVGSTDTVKFSWTYSTADISPGYDLFGVLVDGVATVLSDPGGPLAQNGNYTFTSAQSFGFFVNCTDCVGGAATAAVTNFQVAVVPEPGTVALIFIGGALLSTGLRRRGS